MTPDFDYDEQVAWEKSGLKRAAHPASALLFWFEAQDYALPYPAVRPYAKTTKKELDRAFGWKDHNPEVNIAVGIDPDFEGLERYTITCIKEFGLPIQRTLHDTCGEVIRLIQQQI